MANPPMVNVTARINDQEGRPVAGARVTMRLSTVERYLGLVVPRETTQMTGADGVAVLRVWPNELGTEESEYIVTISHGGQCGTACGNAGISRRFHAVVPNSDCELMDIAELPPYERRGAGQIISAEVAGYAASAAASATASANTLAAMRAAEEHFTSMASMCQSAKTAAQTYADKAERHEHNAGAAIETINTLAAHFETSVTTRTEQTATRLANEASAAVARAKTQALETMETSASSLLNEINQTGANNLAAARTTIINTETAALEHIGTAKKDALDQLREDAALYGEDFEALVERAEHFAKRAACSAGAAANSAIRACKCAERAEWALRNMRALILDAASSIVSLEIIAEAAAKAQVGALQMSMLCWGPLSEEIVRLTDRHTADMCRAARETVNTATRRQEMAEAFLSLEALR